MTTGLTIGSGGSGGVFGPSMVIGGCGGGALGIVLHRLWPALVPHPASFVIVGMAGFFAAAAKTPFSTLVIVSEMTGNYNLLLPTLWVCTLAFLLSDEQSIYSSQVESRSRSPAHQGDYVRDVLAGLLVDPFMTPRDRIPVLSPSDSLAVVLERLGNSPFSSLPVTDADGRYLGMVNLDQVHLASRLPHLEPLVTASDLMPRTWNRSVPATRSTAPSSSSSRATCWNCRWWNRRPASACWAWSRAGTSPTSYLRHVHAIKEKPEEAARSKV